MSLQSACRSKDDGSLRHHSSLSTSRHQRPFVSSTMCLLAFILFTLTFQVTCADNKITATATSSSCSYTLVINEFDASKCTTGTEHAQADGVGVKHAPETVLLKGPEYSGKYVGPKEKVMSKISNANYEGNNNNNNNRGNSPLSDVEAKLLDEMVKSRELNSTLNRHTVMLASAQRTLESYRANFSSVFRIMMRMERKLHQQRRINRSLNRKLSNVILDVVEVNNNLAKRMPVSDARKDGKAFSVESAGKVRSCPGIAASTKIFKDCLAVYSAGHHKSDVYFIKPLYASCPIPVWCDMDSPKGGWLLIQRRKDGKVDFKRNWNAYRDGFGDVIGEHWLGNDNIFLLTNQDKYQLRVDLWDFSGNRVHAIYTTFKIEGERDNYRLHISGYSGSAQDGMHRHNNVMFSTTDRDNDNRRDGNCANEWEAGWWFNKCWEALLNGPYYNSSDVEWRGLAWNRWKREQLLAAEMKIRPINPSRY